MLERKLLKHKLIILFLFIGLSAVAQQGLVMDFGEIDSTEMEVQRNLEYQQFVNGTFGKQFELQEFKLPEFSLPVSTHTPYTVGFGAFPQGNYLGGYLRSNTGANPFFYNQEILSEAAYTLGDKLVVGGYSYGANTMMTAPLPNQNNSYFDTYGSTMFMKYKVSKSVSIETSISVGQNRGVGF